MPLTTKRVFVLVKAYPQPSNRYAETVCCAGITEEGEFIRLYPVAYRALKPEARFGRYDVIELRGERPRSDNRPESFHVDHDSIRIVQRGKDMRPETKARLWIPHVSESLDALKAANDDAARRVSLGIVKPDAGTVRFSWEPLAKAGAEDKKISTSLVQQVSLIDNPLKPLQPPEYSFSYTYRSGPRKSTGLIHDWEVQAAYLNYKRKYGDKGLEMMRDQYQVQMPANNLHLFLGTMKGHPKQFIIVGLLRTSTDVDQVKAQPDMFA